jgi:hypothetical protein
MTKGQVVIGAVFDVKNDDNIGEFDPFFVERIKNCMNLLYDKNFIGRMQDDIFKFNTFKEMNKIQEG